jgi:hypothetical protein
MYLKKGSMHFLIRVITSHAHRTKIMLINPKSEFLTKQILVTVDTRSLVLRFPRGHSLGQDLDIDSFALAIW